MKHSFFAALLLVCAIAMPHRASAVEATVGQTKLELPAPKGYCALDKKNRADAQVLAAVQSALQGRNELLAHFVPCGILDAWHTGKAESLTGDSLEYQASIRLKDTQVKPTYSTDLCGIIRKQSPEFTQKMTDALQSSFKKANELAGNIEFGSMKIYGVLREDKSGCYYGAIMKAKMDGKEETTFTVVAASVVKSKLIFTYFGGDLEDDNTIKRLLAASGEMVAGLHARNR
jgi:hypothetical protein